MRFEDLALNASTQGIQMNASLYSQDINPTQIKMTYNTKISFTDSDGASDGDYFNDNYIMMSIADTIPRLNFRSYRWFGDEILCRFTRYSI